MKNLYKQKRQEGFTIIEVMIVLAIAAVILLIVLLAVPALQRNSRNTQRTNDASQIAAAINTCLSNENGSVTACNTVGTSGVDVDVTKLGQLNTTPTEPASGAKPVGSVNQAQWQFSYTCGGTGGNTPTPTGSTRAFAVDFMVETSGDPIERCISS